MELQFNNTRKVLEEYAKAVTDLYKNKLRESGRKATENLLGSIKTTVTIGNKAFDVDMQLADYWKYVEWDTKPHFPPPGVLLDWIRAKPVIPRPDSRGRIPTETQLDFLIRRKISREGTKGSHDLENTITEINAKYEQRIIEAVTEDFSEATSILIETWLK